MRAKPQVGVRLVPYRECIVNASWLYASALKAPGSMDRVRPLEKTLALIPALRERFRITRLGDTTHLDRIGIPTMCAVVPNSLDLISVYNGKGPTLQHATCSAVMEAVERQCATSTSLPITRCRPADLDDSLDFQAMGMLDEAYERDVEFVDGLDLITGLVVKVPLAAVISPWSGTRTFRMTSTNGLASGNTLLEATYHALFEYVERHGWAIAHTRAYVRPRLLLEGIARASGQTFDPEAMIDDPAVTEVRFPTGDQSLDSMALKIREAALTLRLTILDEPPLPIVMMATINEDHATPVMSHFGLAASWSPVLAATRAITEAAQTRSVDIQGAREDLLRVGDGSPVFALHARRRAQAPHGRWYYDAPLPTAEFSTLLDRSDPCLAKELRQLVSALRELGVRHIVVVDLSPDDLPISVVRVLVPDLEHSLVDGQIGPTLRKILETYPARP